MNQPALSTYIGRVIGERYRITRMLGQGGMGVVFAAEHLFTKREVALKLLHPARVDLPEGHARFLAEARTAATARHPHIVDVLDMGLTADGSPFLVMELLEGISLDKRIAERGRLSPKDALSYLLPIIGALAVLHDSGIVHRDIKPSNIFLNIDARGVVWPTLLDFGLARALSDIRLTRSGTVLGTPVYMAPEHAAGDEATLQSDVWSMGVVLYECVTGQLPFTSRDNQAIAAQVLAGHTRSLHSACPEMPVALAEAIERALRSNRKQRYANMREMARSLVAGALCSGVPLPEDPDSIGLPSYRDWVLSPAPLAVTADLELAPGRALVSPSEATVKATVAQDTSSTTLRLTRRITLLALLFLSFAGGLAWWLAASFNAPLAPAADALAKPNGHVVDPPAPAQQSRGPAPVQMPPPAASLARPDAGQIAMPAAASKRVRPRAPAPRSPRPSESRDPPNGLPKSQGGVQIESEWK